MNVKTLTFGVEIETGMPRGAVTVGSYHRGVTVPNFPERGVWAESTPRTWTAQSDGSIVVPNRTGVEFVSPVLQGLDGLENLAMAVARIKAMGAKLLKGSYEIFLNKNGLIAITPVPATSKV